MNGVVTRNYEPQAPNASLDEQRACEQCGASYEPTKPHQRFCQPKCRVAHWNEAHPRINLGGFKLQKGDPKPTVAQLEAAGFKVRRKA